LPAYCSGFVNGSSWSRVIRSVLICVVSQLKAHLKSFNKTYIGEERSVSD
jgi:hypothetical protein